MKETMKCRCCKRELTVNDIVIVQVNGLIVKNVVNLC